MSVLTLNKVSSSVRGGRSTLYKGCSNRAVSRETPWTGTVRTPLASPMSALCSSAFDAAGLVRLTASALSPVIVIFSREWDVRLELGSLLKSCRILSVCLLGQPASAADMARCFPQPCASPPGWWAHWQPPSPLSAPDARFSSFGSRSIMMCMVHATRNTVSISTLNLRNRIIFSRLSRHGGSL